MGRCKRANPNPTELYSKRENFVVGRGGGQVSKGGNSKGQSELWFSEAMGERECNLGWDTSGNCEASTVGRENFASIQN